jgi:hypothetical protein
MKALKHRKPLRVVIDRPARTPVAEYRDLIEKTLSVIEPALRALIKDGAVTLHVRRTRVYDRSDITVAAKDYTRPKRKALGARRLASLLRRKIACNRLTQAARTKGV